MMEQKLKQARTMNEILKICSDHYDLDQPLGVATKSMVIMGVKRAIKLTKAKPRNNG